MPAPHRDLTPSIDPLRASFDSWCRTELFTPALRQAVHLVDRYCDLQLCALYRELHLAEQLATPKTAGQLAAALGLVDTADIALRDVLRRLGERTGAVRVDGPPLAPAFAHVHDPPDPTDELPRVRAELVALSPDYAAATDFLDFGRRNFLRALRDEPELMDAILAGNTGEHAELWYRATNVDPLQDLHGAMGARVVDGLLTRPSTLLEIGGGTGNGARHLLRHLHAQGRLRRLTRYVFTDISLRFVLASKHELAKAYPTVAWHWQFFDLNQPFSAQRIAPESIDLVYAVNAAHVATDIVAFLRGCREALRPGGHVVFAERVRVRPYEMAPRELALDLSVYHRTAAERASYRPMHCYLAPDHWRDVLALAGFSHGELLPDLDAWADELPGRYAAVVVGTK